MMKYKCDTKANGFSKIALGILFCAPVFAHADKYDDELNALKLEVQDLKKIVIQQQVELEKNIDTKSKTHTDTTTGFLSKSGMKVNLYGFIRGDASYQFKGGDGIFNRINKVDLDDNNTNEDRFYSTVTTSRLGLDFTNSQENQPISGKLEIDFRGGSNSDTVRIRHVYLNYKNLLIGQTTSSFLDTDNHPQMLDFGSPLGIGTKRIPMLRYSVNINNQTKLFLGLEQGASDNRLPSLTSKGLCCINM